MISTNEAICKITKQYDVKSIEVDGDIITIVEGSKTLFIGPISTLLDIPYERINYGKTLNKLIIDLSPIKKFNFVEIMNKLNAYFSNSSDLFELKRNQESIIVRVRLGCGICVDTLERLLVTYDCVIEEIEGSDEYYSIKIAPKSDFNLLTASEDEIKSKLSNVGVPIYIKIDNTNETIVIGFNETVKNIEIRKALELLDEVGTCRYGTSYGCMFVINKLQLETLCD